MGFWGRARFLARVGLAGLLGMLAPGCAWHHGDECEECRAPEYHAIGGYSPMCDPHVTEAAARDCADEALDAYGDVDDHYEDGFEQAYVDLAKGATGVTPPIPPQRYYQAHYRSAGGHAAARQWFAGYEAGVASARERGAYQFNTVATSYVPILEPWEEAQRLRRASLTTSPQAVMGPFPAMAPAGVTPGPLPAIPPTLLHGVPAQHPPLSMSPTFAPQPPTVPHFGPRSAPQLHTMPTRPRGFSATPPPMSPPKIIGPAPAPAPSLAPPSLAPPAGSESYAPSPSPGPSDLPPLSGPQFGPEL